jgi:hypothetical protein
MPAFAQHLQVSSVLGVGYAAALWHTGVAWPHAALAGPLCAVAGMLPDLDSDSGKPTREVFGVTAALGALLLLHRLRKAGMEAEEALLLASGGYLAIRFGAAWLFKRLTVHRGMFHSVPAAGIAAEVAYLVHDGPEPHGQLLLAGGAFLGYLSHLVLDELSGIGHGTHLRLNKAAGSALKLASRSVSATLLAWSILAGLTYLVGVERGYFPPLHLRFSYPATYRSGGGAIDVRSTPTGA